MGWLILTVHGIKKKKKWKDKYNLLEISFARREMNKNDDGQNSAR